MCMYMFFRSVPSCTMATPLETRKTFVYFQVVRISCRNPRNCGKNKRKRLVRVGPLQDACCLQVPVPNASLRCVWRPVGERQRPCTVEKARKLLFFPSKRNDRQTRHDFVMAVICHLMPMAARKSVGRFWFGLRFG